MIGKLFNKIDYKKLKAFRNNILFFRFFLLLNRAYHYVAIKKIRRKPKIKVAFLAIHDSMWKYEDVYGFLKSDARFDPVVIVCPFVRDGDDVMKTTLTKTFNYFKDRNYNVLNSLLSDGSWLDIKREISPDIIFFTSPYQISRPEYYIFNFLETLTCYVPYNFGNSHLFHFFHDLDFHNLLWRFYAESPLHKEYSARTARNRGRNVVVTGYPGCDRLLNGKVFNDKIWKDSSRKKIIWAPHHTIEQISEIGFSSFLRYHQYFLNILDNNKDTVEIAFKPHPLLKNKLYEHPGWGPEKTNEYYKRWDDSFNGFLADSDYIDLFLSSDCLIHDSGSFLIEYLCTEKPVLRLDKDDLIKERLNSFAQMAYDVHYIAKNEEQVNQFMEMVLTWNDVMKPERTAFKERWLNLFKGTSASEMIYKSILHDLKFK